MQGNIAAEIRVLLGEEPFDPNMFNDEQRDRRIVAMKKAGANTRTYDEQHKDWVETHIKNGWIYEETFDPSKKIHPNLKPWNELPSDVKSKIKIFTIVSKAACKLADEWLNSEEDLKIN